ncbi:MAG: signal peptidase I [bacterium]|nr:signal peptidase I [bacterium]
MRKFFWSSLEILEIIAISVFAVFIIRTFLFQPFLVSGASMEPTFSNGNYILVDEISYRFREPQRGEVIVFKPPVGGSYFIKRIIGLPNEKVKIQDGEVTIFDTNGGKILLKESYVPANIKTFGDLEVVLKPDQYFVLGDNRNYSFDSRAWGFLAKDKIIGLVKLRIWPITSVMAVGKPNY